MRHLDEIISIILFLNLALARIQPSEREQEGCSRSQAPAWECGEAELPACRDDPHRKPELGNQYMFCFGCTQIISIILFLNLALARIQPSEQEREGLSKLFDPHFFCHAR